MVLAGVLMVFRGRYFGLDPTSKQLTDFEAGLHRTMALMTASHKRVYYFMPVVEPGFDPRLCVGELPWGRKPPRACEIDQKNTTRTFETLRQVLQAVQTRYPNLQVIDPNVHICDNGLCPMFRDGHSLFKDDNHLSYYGSIWIGQKLK
mgnify:CR=1 FL=1